MSTYVPRKGDYIAVTFDPQSGHEQKGRLPALVVSTRVPMVGGAVGAGRGDGYREPHPFAQARRHRSY